MQDCWKVRKKALHLAEMTFRIASETLAMFLAFLPPGISIQQRTFTQRCDEWRGFHIPTQQNLVNCSQEFVTDTCFAVVSEYKISQKKMG